MRKEWFDTVVCLNVIEHIENDVAALRHIGELLESGGRTVLLVPAHQWLFCRMSQKLGHYRRYNRASFRQWVTAAGLVVESDFYFNPTAIPGWLLVGKLLGRDLIPDASIQFYDRFLPVLRACNLFPWPFGISLILIASKPAGS